LRVSPMQWLLIPARIPHLVKERLLHGSLFDDSSSKAHRFKPLLSV
jgi:hypothetical protein